MITELIDAFCNAKNSEKLIHCITNPISINLCANTILALGNKPIMAEHPREVFDITRTSDALLVNIGNITDARMKSIKISIKAAKKKALPVVFDVVGIACSNLRKAYAKKIIKKYTPDVIKGNYSEIFALYKDEYRSKGVDSESFDVDDIARVAMHIANKFNCTVLASGKTDVIATREKYACVNNGVKQLSDITGTGCILGSLVATFISVNSTYIGTVLACIVLGVAGEQAESQYKNGTFQTKLIDELSSFNIEEIKDKIKLEEKINEAD